MENIRQIFVEKMDKRFDKGTSHFNHQRFGDAEKSKTRRLVGLQHQAEQMHFATKTDTEPCMKTHKRTGDAAADRAKNGYYSSNARVDDSLTSLTSFGKIAKFLLKASEKCIGDALVKKGVEAPKLHRLPLEERFQPPVAGGLIPVATNQRTIFLPSPHSWSNCETEETDECSSATNCQTNVNQLAPLF